MTPVKNNGVTSEIGHAILVLRAWRRLSQADLAERSGLNPSHISLMESGDRRPSLAALKRISGALRTNSFEVIRLAEELAEGKWRP